MAGKETENVATKFQASSFFVGHRSSLGSCLRQDKERLWGWTGEVQKKKDCVGEKLGGGIRMHDDFSSYEAEEYCPVRWAK